MLRYILIILIPFFCFCTNKKTNPSTDNDDKIDTIIAGRLEGYEPYTKEYFSLPIILFSSPETGASVYEFKKDSVYVIKCELTGFKNRKKTYPLKIVSDGIEIIKRDSILKTYEFKLIKDTAKVVCYIEGQYKNIIYWRNDLRIWKSQRLV